MIWIGRQPKDIIQEEDIMFNAIEVTSNQNRFHIIQATPEVAAVLE
jgi:hypothetical protein